MGEQGSTGAWTGAAAVVLFLAGALVIGERPPFDAPGAELADHFAVERTRIRVGAALDAVAAMFLVWFLAIAWSRGREHVAAAVGFGCGVAFVALFLVDVTALAAGGLRADELTPGGARLLVDLEWTAIGIATPMGVGMLAAFAALALRHDAVWPRSVGLLGIAAAAVYALRIGTLFTDDGPFAADGVLGLYLPVAALLVWTLGASVALTRRTTRRAG